MKTIQILFLFVGMFVSGAAGAQTFRASDLDGKWKRSDGMVLDIKGTSTFVEGSDALVIDVGNSGWPQSARMVAFKFRNLKHKEGNQWQGINYMHMPQSNYRKEDGKVNIVMADDKKSFSANGTTYTKQ
ncbi:hypothetical protein [Flavobacterium sp. MK4S-17]|jgi:hypothetical protein|uniref:hypothetical protein n=1 Tax=Flavobacterium sp. MK4S-17 TaxID=2543737 RepID=UPI00135C8817|nr:hypothetical protein [Flavobacterium sp. MK4S-17]